MPSSPPPSPPPSPPKGPASPKGAAGKGAVVSPRARRSPCLRAKAASPEQSRHLLSLSQPASAATVPAAPAVSRARAGARAPLVRAPPPPLDQLTLVGALGTGGFGRVQLMRHAPTRRVYALKVTNVPTPRPRPYPRPHPRPYRRHRDRPHPHPPLTPNPNPNPALYPYPYPYSYSDPNPNPNPNPSPNPNPR